MASWTDHVDATAGTLTLAEVRGVVVSLREREQRERREAMDAYLAFMAQVPEQFKDHPEIVAMATFVMWSQSNPVHPRERDSLQRRYDEIVNG